MAHRIYKSWLAYQRENSIRTLFQVKLVHEARVKSSFFALWRTSKSCGKKESFIAKNFTLGKPLSMSSLQGNIGEAGKVNTQFNYKMNLPNPIQQSHHSLYQFRDLHESQESLNQEPSFGDRLYNQATQKAKPSLPTSEAKSLEECTFRPEISTYGQSKSSVYQNFDPAAHKEKEEFYKHQKAQKELEGCTFHPRTNFGKNLSLDRSFEKLYHDAEVHRQKMRNKELVEKDKEIAECTFKPQVLNPSKSVSGNVYEKLYKNYQESQREKRRLQLEKEAKEIEESTFTPKLMTPKREGENVPVYIRLYSEMEKKKEKQRKEEEKIRPASVNQVRAPEDPPRYESLYALHKETSQKRVALQEKVLKESGAVFKPNTSKPGTPKRSRESPLRSK